MFFCNGGNERCYISSADWMTRNLDYRVEVAAPIYDAEVRAELALLFQPAAARYVPRTHHRRSAQQQLPSRPRQSSRAGGDLRWLARAAQSRSAPVEAKVRSEGGNA
jgi:polyphosphate kinase